MQSFFLTQAGLAIRWGISERTLEGWRWQKKGPRFVRIGARVRYPLVEVERFEQAYDVAGWR